MLVIHTLHDVRWLDFHGPGGEFVRIYADRFPTRPGQLYGIHCRGQSIGYLVGLKRAHGGLGVDVPREWKILRSNARPRPGDSEVA